MNHDITLTVDYHDKNCVIRRLDRATGEERVWTAPTSRRELEGVVREAYSAAAPRGGRVTWIQESTTGWARVKELVQPYARFVLANVLQMPLPPKARRRKTDKVDTARLQREFLSGALPLAHQPPAGWRQARRLAALRENLVNRRTALTNWINRYLAHETWVERSGLWSRRGLARLRALPLPELDRRVVDWKHRGARRAQGAAGGSGASDHGPLPRLAAGQASRRHSRHRPGGGRFHPGPDRSGEAVSQRRAVDRVRSLWRRGSSNRTRRVATDASAAAGPTSTCAIT